MAEASRPATPVHNGDQEEGQQTSDSDPEVIINPKHSSDGAEDQGWFLEMKRLELEHRKLELELADRREQREFELKKIELLNENGKLEGGRAGDSDKVSKIANYIKLLEHMLPTAPANAEEVLDFFDSLERAFMIHEIPRAVQGKLLIAFFNTECVNHLCRRLTIEQCNVYETVKEAILAEFHLTSDVYLKQFTRTRKVPGESYIQLCSRVKRAYTYYVSRSEVTEFEELVNLSVADKFKSLLSPELKTYLLQRGATSKLEKVETLAELCDMYESHVGMISQDGAGNKPGKNLHHFVPKERDRFKCQFSGNTDLQKLHFRPESVALRQDKAGYGDGETKSTFRGRNGYDSSKNFVCFLCGIRGHLKSSCPKRKITSNGSESWRRGPEVSKKVNRVILSESEPLTSANGDVDIPGLSGSEKNNDSDKLIALVHNAIRNDRATEMLTEVPVGNTVLLANEVGETAEAMVDTGAQFTCVRKEILGEEIEPVKGKVVLTGFDGSKGTFDVKELNLRLMKKGSVKAHDDKGTHDRVICAIVPNLMGQVLLTAEDFNRLQETHDASPVWISQLSDNSDSRGNDLVNNINAVTSGANENNGHLAAEGDTNGQKHIDGSTAKCTDSCDKGENSETKVDDEVNEKRDPEASRLENVGEADNENSLRDTRLFKQQLFEDPSLKYALEQAKFKKNNFEYLDGLLYHKDHVLGQPVLQLVVPIQRREQILKLAHDSMFGAHLGFRKTLERIKYSFYWPTIRNEVKEYCETCKECQLRRPQTRRDQIPIEAVRRPPLPFQVVNVDLIGPIEPPSSKGHKWILVLVDQHSRWPECVCLTSLTAKSTCDALLEIFQRTGIPEIVATDRGTNFVSALTQEMFRRIGASPRFSAPGHPSSNGLVERFNRVLKNMLHHVIREEPRQWHKVIPFLLWAYREVPNSTTGISPFQLLYGRKPKGPLSILKKNWAGECELPIGISVPAAQYLQDLKARMELTASQVKEIAEEQQRRYTTYYNRQLRHKEFNIGDRVIALIPDSTNKLYARWTGPAVVSRRRGGNSYDIQLSDGSTRHVHVNKLRGFRPRIGVVGVIFEDDEEFGRVTEIPVVGKEQKSRGHVVADGENLTPGQLVELRTVISKFRKFFSGKIGRLEQGKHEIRLTPGSVLKTKHRYTVPQAMRKVVDAQIQELLDNEMIEECHEDYSHPIVCVTKKDGTIRMCVDYRMVNSHTISPEYPMEHISDLLAKVGAAHYISTLDMLRGYYQIVMDDESKRLTAFATPRGLFQWKVMPFGLVGAPATYQRIMNRILRPHQNYAVAYLDDVAVFSRTWEEHIVHLEKVLLSLETAGATGNLEKCCFARKKVRYLGHIVGNGEHAPDPEKLDAIKQMRPPRTKKEVKSFLGLAGYYREYVPNFSDIAKPLTDLTSKKTSDKIQWNDSLNAAFETLKEKLITAPVLATPDFHQPFVLCTDASQYCVAACLAQKDPQGKIRPVAYASRKLSEVQTRWATSHKEAYAIVFGVQKFEGWVFGHKVEIWSDHNPLTHLSRSASQNSKLQRWSLALQQFDLSIHYVPGKAIPHVDALSRISV